MSTTGTEATDFPTDSTPPYHGRYHYEDEASYVFEEEVLVLNTEDFISGPFLSDKCTVPYEILELDYSYGYDCKKYFNLIAPDADSIVFIGGNLIHFFDVKTGNLTFRRSYLGGGLGHITVNPNSEYPHLTVAENGENPPIIIYEWPTMEIAGILKDGAAQRYSHINYSPDGEMLVSQSYGPDFLITVWEWKKWRHSPIILRTKSHVHDVYKCMFSPYVPGQLTTGGGGHIKFWKMAQTFTGLKLQGELGRFGKTEISDIVGIFPMPDEKVISGTEWGNLLVWEAGLIKIEVFRTLRRHCHDGPVLQLEYVRPKGEIWSISQDGWLRAWEYRIIDEADPPDEDRVVQMVPSYEREIPNVQFLSICKKHVYEPEDIAYYAQDSNGGIWLVDLTLSSDFEPPQRLLSCHAGRIVDMAACPWGPFVVSLGEAGTIFMYNYEERTLLYQYQFRARGRALIWVPLKFDPTGSYFIAAFDDGVIRIFVINFQTGYDLKIVQSTKPHNKPITVMSLNNQGSLFVTGGEDLTIFIFKVNREESSLSLQPIGFVPIKAIPTCFTWHPDESKETILLVGCQYGHLYEFDLPLNPLPYTLISYLLHTIKPVQQRFTTCKAQIRRDIYISQIEARKQEKIERKKLEIIQIKSEGLQVDEDLYLQDSESEEVLEPLHIPEIPNTIFFTQYTEEDTIWLSMGGYDAGYIYEYHMDQKQKEPLKATIIEAGDDIEMHGYIYSPDGNYIITSMQDGSIRINRINPDNFRDLSDYWLLSMHDNFNGRITKMCFSYDSTYFFSCGEDGIMFSFKYNPSEEEMPEHRPKIKKLSVMPPVKRITVDQGYDSLSLEEAMIKAEEDKQMRLANEHKRKLRLRLKELTAKLASLLDRNCKLPISQRYFLREFIVDERIMKALDDMLEAKVALERRKLAFDVEKSTLALSKMKKHYTDILDMYPFVVHAIDTKYSVNTIIIRGLHDKFFDTYQDVLDKAEEEKLKGRVPPRKEVVGESKMEIRKTVHELEPFLVGLSPSTLACKLGTKLTRLLNKYRARKRKIEIRQDEWNTLYAQKPVEGVNLMDDVRALEIAQATIGDFKLKTSPHYKVPPGQKETTVSKYKELLKARLRASKNMVNVFNMKIYNLREKKVKLIETLKYLTEQLKIIHEEIPESRILTPPPVPVMTDADFPEKEIELQLTVPSDFETYLINLKPKKISETVTSVTCDTIDWEKEALGLGKLQDVPGTCRELIMSICQRKDFKFNPFKKHASSGEEVKESKCEKEIKYRRLLKKLHEQKTIIDSMYNMIAEFDKEVLSLNSERFTVVKEHSFLEMHILCLNQELIIVKDFEIAETEFSAVAYEKWTDMMDMRDSMKLIELKIESHNYNIEGYQEQIKVLQQTFLTAAKDNKFWDFLRRIFKKKYRPPKLTDESDSSSMSSESSSDEEDDDDAGSLDSGDIGPIRLDENTCPKGCDKELYDYTFTLRNRRHDMEKQIQEEKKNIENCKKELEQSAKKMKIYDQANKKAQDDLEEYQALKQKKLNEVNCLVLLKLSQLRHINPDGYSVANLRDTLVFGVERLHELYSRVTELQLETLAEHTKHMKNKIHLHRMTVDCRSMQITIAKLKKEIVDKMILKLGTKVKIDDVEESILKRMVLTLRIQMLNLGAVYEKEIEQLRVTYGEKQVEIKNVIRENTARLEILAVLNKEKAALAKHLELQAKTKEKTKSTDDAYYIKDVDKLSVIVKSQQEQIEMLKSEIKMLSTKSLPPKPITHEVAEKLPEDSEDDLHGDFGSLDELYEPPEYHAPNIVTVVPSVQDPDITEEEIVICIHELMKEVVESVLITEETEEKMVVKILTEIIEQIPMDYIERETSVEYMAGLITGIVTDITKLDSASIVKKVSVSTSHSSEKISSIVGRVKVRIMDDKEPKETTEKKTKFRDLL